MLPSGKGAIITINNNNDKTKEQLRASEQHLQAANQQLRASEQQFRAANQQLTATEQQLRAANQQLNASNQQLRANEQELRTLNLTLRERIKELDYFYNLSILVEKPGLTLEGLLQGAADLIPPAWQYPEITCGRIVLREGEFKTENFRETSWKQTTSLIVRGEVCGTLEVGYLEEIPERDEGPFLKEERTLINVIAERLGRIIERFRGEAELRAANQQLDATNQQLTAGEQQLRAANQQLDAINKRFRESEAQKRKILDGITTNIAFVNKELEIIWANKTAAASAGKKREEMVGHLCHEFWGDPEKPCENCPTLKAFITGNTEATIMHTPDGRIWEERGEPIFDQDGKITGAIEIAQDITERKRTEAELEKYREHLEELVAARTSELKESEEKYRTLIESSRDAIMTLAPPTWLFTAGNKTTIEMFGARDEKEFISKSPWELSPEYQPDGELSSEKALQMTERAMETGSNFFEWTHRRLDGENFPATVLLSRIKLQDKELLQSTVRDITDRKKAEEDLKEKIKELEIFYDAAVDRELRMEELRKEIEELKNTDLHR
ncbi:MAG: PAS domain S-box protein [Candidatus Auribacterota bacterium]|nr:PAS domain S-box protein [Candidatus Auribacterota bacterium]